MLADQEKLFDLLSEDMFFLERHQLIYRSQKRIVAAGNEIDLRTLQAKPELAGAV